MISGADAGVLAVAGALTGPVGAPRLTGLLGYRCYNHGVNERAERLQALQIQIALEYFNERRYHDCYEALERIWRVSGGTDRSLWQGIIQIAGAGEKLLAGNWRGAVSLLDTGLMLIEPYRPRHRGIAVDRLHSAGEACLKDLVKLGEGGIANFDLARLPRIEFERVRLDPKPR